MTGPVADQLATQVDRLHRSTLGWSATRWSAPPERSLSTRDFRSKADVAYGLAQQLADLAADRCGQPRRRVPRLAADVALTDQIRVLAHDVVLLADENIAAAALAVVREHRAAIDGSRPA